MLRVGMLTSGGDCQALNAAMRGTAKCLYERCGDVEIYGFEDGYKGLINGVYRIMKNRAELYSEHRECRLNILMSRLLTEEIRFSR